ncbi:ANTAR domain-containing protein, partial [Kribbella pittospori]
AGSPYSATHESVRVRPRPATTQQPRAVTSYRLVGQAMGILMERFDLDGDRAFTILKRYSQDNNRKLRDVAQQLIDTRKLPANQNSSTNRLLAPEPVV